MVLVARLEWLTLNEVTQVTSLMQVLYLFPLIVY